MVLQVIESQVRFEAKAHRAALHSIDPVLC